VRHRQEPAFSLGRSPCPHTWSLDATEMQPYTAPVCAIMVSTPAIHAITWITTHLLTLEDGRLSWPNWLTHSRQLTHRVVTCQP